MFEQELKEMNKLSEADKYCYEYYQKNGHYMAAPTKNEIIYFLNLFWENKTPEQQFFLAELLNEEDKENLSKIFQPEKLFFQSNININLYVSNRYFTMMEHAHDYIEIECIMKGNAVHDPCGDHIELKEGDIIIVPPHVPHNLQPLDAATLVSICIRYTTFEKTFRDMLNCNLSISRYFKNMLYGNQANSLIIITNALDDFARTLIIMLYRENKLSDKISDKVNTHLLQSFLYYVAQNSTQNQISDATMCKNETILHIRRFMIEHMQEVSLNMLSHEFHLSIPYLSRFINKHTGVNFSELLKTIRLEHSKELLVGTTDSIYNISVSVGYECESYFINIFRKTYGITPLQYRKLKNC